MIATPDRLNFGSVAEEGVKKIWGGPAYEEFRRQLASDEPPKSADLAPCIQDLFDAGGERRDRREARTMAGASFLHNGVGAGFAFADGVVGAVFGMEHLALFCFVPGPQPKYELWPSAGMVRADVLL